MLGVQSVYGAARLQDGCGQNSVVDVGSATVVPFAIKLTRFIDDLLIDSRSIKPYP